MSSNDRKYAFSWEFVGRPDASARKNLGGTTSIEAYRLFQFTIRDALEQHYGTEAADTLFFEAGVLAGRAFFERYGKEVTDVPTLAKVIQTHFKDLGIGIVRFEKTDLDSMTFELTVDEDLDCSGLPDTQEHICVYDEGLIKGILERFSGKQFLVREVDCWCSGARTCRFRATFQE